jgi:hypothetical protein
LTPARFGPSIVGKGRGQPGIVGVQFDGNALQCPLLVMGKCHLRYPSAGAIAGRDPAPIAAILLEATAASWLVARAS